MRFAYKCLTSLIILTAIPTAAIAQPSPIEPIRSETIPEAFYRAFFTNAPDFYRDRSLLRQLNSLFGISSFTRNSYPENEYIRDARLVNILYQDILQQQVGNTTLRTPDLQNPYNTSVFSEPPAQATPTTDTTPDAEDANQNEIDSPLPEIPAEDAPSENGLESGDFEGETESPEIVPFE
ncbi:hypothetical protein [Chroococcidiopsis sp. TS-821]|uniref:hypothetical protein n=1 Tax=Chroococcidiopsis sp. TS-821 TaxID=1378066 RepID=UPI000CEE0971|nr:hypothetical protein [Chroococcidiopsis sp. TS-821]PPS39118.1 hypothetical protein B1A85_22895 [Chroococcidiopsis sp. TS-821]